MFCSCLHLLIKIRLHIFKNEKQFIVFSNNFFQPNDAHMIEFSKGLSRARPTTMKVKNTNHKFTKEKKHSRREKKGRGEDNEKR
jgi:hypothetical protein